jgi:FkbM family methyltransferase
MLKPLLKSLAGCFGMQIVSQKRSGLDVFRDIKPHLSPISGPLQMFDIGANEGQTARELLHAYPQAVIHSFEPTPEPFAVLQKLAFANPDRLKVHPIALSDTVGTAPFFINSFTVTNSLLASTPQLEDYRPPSPQESIEVSLQTVDSFCDEKSISAIHLLKTDTQGADLKVIQGAHAMIAKKRVPYILTEVLFERHYDGQASFEEIFENLQSQGYSLVNLYSVIHSKNGTAAWADALFLNPEALATVKASGHHPQPPRSGTKE